VWRFPAALLAAALIAFAAYPAAPTPAAGTAAVSRKLDLIESGRFRPGTRVDFRVADLNSWFRDEARDYFGNAVTHVRIETGYNAVTGYANIDFVKLRQATTGEAPGWLMRNLFAGERPVVIKLHFASERGVARVDLDLVQISGVPIEGSALDFVVRNYVRPTFPDVKISQWFPLADHVDRVSTSPAGASVLIGR
jgi:hypothetical protein